MELFITLSLVFWRATILSSIVAIPTYIPTNCGKGFYFLHTPAFLICIHFNDHHADWYEAAPNCSFDLHFFNNKQCWASLHVPGSHLNVFFGKIFRSSVHFSIGSLAFVCLFLNCTNHLFWRLSPCRSHNLQVFFSHSVDCLFILFMVSFAMKKLVSLIRSHLFVFGFFLLLPWKTDQRKQCYDLCQRMFCLCSLLGVLWFSSKSLIL